MYTFSLSVATGDGPWPDYPAIPEDCYLAAVVRLPPTSGADDMSGLLTGIRNKGEIDMLYHILSIESVLTRLLVDLKPDFWCDGQNWVATTPDISRNVLLLAYRSEAKAAELYHALKPRDALDVIGTVNLLGAMIDATPFVGKMTYATVHSKAVGDVHFGVNLIQQFYPSRLV